MNRLPSSRALAVGVLSSCVLVTAPGRTWGQETDGVPWTGEPGITETVAEIMEREQRAPKVAAFPPRETKPEVEFRKLLPPRLRPGAPAVPRWPMLEGALAAPGPYNPQTVGTSFLAAQLSESGFIPPDSMGDVGPTQILVAINGRIKVFDKNGVLGGLNATTDVFFNSVRNGAGTSDPHIRYDRLSQRWFVTIINTPVPGPNRVLIAVSSGPTILSSSSFTFFQFQQDTVGTPGPDLNGFADYDTLGVDKFALYIGVNMFNQALTAFVGTTGFVVNKANLLSATLTVTAFRQMAGNTCPGAGPYTPQGVHNDDPSATQGYFVGVDICLFSTLQVRRVSDPGGVPTLSGNLAVNVPTTSFPIPQVQPGGPPALDALDDRLYAAAIRRNKITGASTLWTAHNVEVNTSGAGQAGGGRNGSRWYEVGSLTGTPALIQAGTLFDSAGSTPFGYWIPSVAMSGQGHMALGASRASTVAASGPAGGHASISVAGRLRPDVLGTIQAPTLAVDSDSRYDVGASSPDRWGDYSQVGVDPNDDMTMWTFQEYANATNSYGVRAIKLIPPPPATPASASPSAVSPGQPSVSVTITGSSIAGSEFFDPGPDSGGPGFANHITASVSGGVTVNSVTFISPTQVTLDVSTIGAPVGPKDVTITNPDGQSRTGIGILAVVVVGPPPSMSIGDAVVTEGNAGFMTALFTVSLSAASGTSTTVQYATTNGTATAAGGDYVATSGKLTIPAGATSGTIAVGVRGDTLAEPDETFFVDLTSPTGAVLTDARGQGTIVNDDGRRSLCRPIVSLPYTITIQGNYCLVQNLSTAVTAGNAITIASDFVNLDLKGFKIGGGAAGPGTQANGVYARDRQNVSIKNGNIRGFFRAVYLEDTTGTFTASQGHVVQNVRADENTYEGIHVQGRGNVVRNNQVVTTGGTTVFGADADAYGIHMEGPEARVLNNDVTDTNPAGAGAGIAIAVEQAGAAVVEKNRLANSIPNNSYGVKLVSGDDILVIGNRIARTAFGVFYDTATGRYRDNLATGVATPYAGGTDAGNNQ